MKTYTFVIGSIDDFDFIESLMDYVDQEGTSGHLNYSCHEFEAPEECDEDTVMMIGRGIAFSNDWCSDGTLSFLIHGEIKEDEDSTQMQMHDLWEMPSGDS